MNDNIFVNEAINSGILNFINNTNSNDFTTIIIKTLIHIYGQLDIINPYKTNSESSFDDNITKFGYKKEDLSIFKQNVMNFYLSINEHPNKYFNEIEKQLIDMYFIKVKKTKQDIIDIENFKKMIQFESTELNSLYSINNGEISKYFSFKSKLNSCNIKYYLIENNTLNKEAYEFLGYSYDNINNMNNQQIAEINKKIFEYFKIDDTKDDKYLRVDQAIAYYKQFPKKQELKKENGYVELVLLSAFVLVSILAIIIVVVVLS